MKINLKILNNDIDDIYKYVVGFYIVVILAFDYSRFFSVLSNIAYLVLAGLSIFVICKNKKFSFPIELVGIVLFCLFSLFSLIYAPDLDLAVSKCITILLMSSIPILVVMSSKKDKSYMEFYFKCIVVGAIIPIIISFFSETAPNGRFGDNISDCNAMAKSIALAAIIVLHYAINKYKKLYVLYFLLAVPLLLTQSKSGLILFLVFTVAVITINWKNISTTEKVGLFVLIVIAIFICLTNEAIYSILSRMRNMITFFLGGNKEIDYSTYERLMLKQQGIEFIKQKPLFGYGIGQSIYLLDGSYFHDDFIQVAVEIGLLGLMVYLFPFISCIIKCFKKKNYLVLLLLLCNLMSGAFNTLYYHKITYILLAISLVSLREKDDKNKIILNKEKLLCTKNLML